MTIAESITKEIDRLCKDAPEEAVVEEVVRALYRRLEKRGYRDGQIVEYLRSIARKHCVGGIV